jgi:hypothetical protein
MTKVTCSECSRPIKSEDEVEFCPVCARAEICGPCADSCELSHLDYDLEDEEGA